MNKQSEGFFFLIATDAKTDLDKFPHKNILDLFTQISAFQSNFYSPESTWLFWLTAKRRIMAKPRGKNK